MTGAAGSVAVALGGVALISSTLTSRQGHGFWERFSASSPAEGLALAMLGASLALLGAGTGRRRAAVSLALAATVPIGAAGSALLDVVCLLILALTLTGLASTGRWGRTATATVPSAALLVGLAAVAGAYTLSFAPSDAGRGDPRPIVRVAFLALAIGIATRRPDLPPVRVFVGTTSGAVTARRLLVVVALEGLLVAGLVRGVNGPPGWPTELLGAVAVVALLVCAYRVLAWIVTSLDRAEEQNRALVAALREEHDLSHRMLVTLPDGAMTLDPNGVVMHVSPRWCALTGYRADEAVGLHPPFPWWPPEHVAERTAQFDAIAASDRSVDIPTVLRRADGADLDVVVTAFPVHDAERHVRQIVAMYRDVTDHRRVQAEAERRAQQLDHFFEMSDDLLCIATTDGWFTRVNPAWEQTFGYTAEELTSRPYLDFVHPDDVASTMGEAATLAGGEPMAAFVNRYRCRDGSYRWLSWRATPSPDEGIVYAVGRDVTDERQAAEAATLLAAIVDGTHDAIIGKTLDGTIVSWNEGAERLFGYRRQEVLGRSIHVLSPPLRAGEIDAFLARVGAGQAVIHQTIERQHADGSLIPLDLSISPIRDHAGAIVGAASIASDITARIKAQAQFERLLQSAPVAMVIVDAEGRVVLANEQTERLFGYAAADLVGRPIETLVPPQLRKAHAAHRRNYLAAPQHRGMGAGLDLSGLRRDGTTFPVEISLGPLDSDDSRLVSAVILDTSERRALTETLQRARDDAIAAANLKSQFVAVVSHEIRTPMNGVIGLTRLLLETPLKPAQRRYVESIRTSGHALLTIINDILDFSKIEAGRVEVVEERFGLGVLLDEVTRTAGETGRSKGLEILCHYPPELAVTVRGDRGRLRQALLNLVGNAVKFTEKGEVTMLARPATDPPDGRLWVTVDVTDTGIGIGTADLPHLFEPFSQAEATSNRRFGGTGLGLTISRQLVELLGGELHAESRLGSGSRFSLTLPLALESDAAEPTRSGGTLLAGRRALIVDDNATSRELLGLHVRAWGMTVAAVADGETALAALRQAVADDLPYDVAVVDQEMPGLDGLQVTENINTDARLEATKVVLLSSGSYDDEEAGAAAGAAASIPKPVGLSELLDCLATVLNPDAPARTSDTLTSDERSQSRGTVLLAEDNAINQMVAIDTLALLGYDTEVANNGLEAVELATTRRYQAILMDCQMPRMDGFVATAEVRRQEHSGEHIPIIAMTAGALADDEQRCLDAGMDAYLTKPIDFDELRAALDRWAVGAR